MSFNVYQKVTDQIIEMIKTTNKLPWEMPFLVGGQVNVISKKEYQGINTLLLGYAQSQHGFPHPYWLTFAQALSLGGSVRKGEKSPAYVVFFKMLSKLDDNGEDTGDVIPLLRYSNVFNVSQCDGINWVPPTVNTFTPIAELENFWQGMAAIPTLTHASGSAFYSPTRDTVNVPNPDQFTFPILYYKTLAHELVHSTGHPARLDRFAIDSTLAPFGSPDYGKEELVAELGAAMILGKMGLAEELPMNQSAAYIQSWLTALSSNPTWITWAASRAAKSADYILGTHTPPPEDLS